MIKDALLKDAEFEAVAEVRVDAKHRVTLGKLVPSRITGFKMYRNAHGQMILDPMVSIPAHEAWLFKKKKAISSVRRGLEDAKQGRLVNAKEDFSKHVRGKV